VEVIAEGERSALEALIRALREGPPGADVRDFEVDWDEAPPREREFTIR
jgi:acylphosphatase